MAKTLVSGTYTATNGYKSTIYSCPSTKFAKVTIIGVSKIRPDNYGVGEIATGVQLGVSGRGIITGMYPYSGMATSTYEYFTTGLNDGSFMVAPSEYVHISGFYPTNWSLGYKLIIEEIDSTTVLA
jgi:hypothetical protein